MVVPMHQPMHHSIAHYARPREMQYPPNMVHMERTMIQRVNVFQPPMQQQPNAVFWYHGGR